MEMHTKNGGRHFASRIAFRRNVAKKQACAVSRPIFLIRFLSKRYTIAVISSVVRENVIADEEPKNHNIQIQVHLDGSLRRQGITLLGANIDNLLSMFTPNSVTS